MTATTKQLVLLADQAPTGGSPASKSAAALLAAPVNLQTFCIILGAAAARHGTQYYTRMRRSHSTTTQYGSQCNGRLPTAACFHFQDTCSVGPQTKATDHLQCCTTHHRNKPQLTCRATMWASNRGHSPPPKHHSRVAPVQAPAHLWSCKVMWAPEPCFSLPPGLQCVP